MVGFLMLFQDCMTRSKQGPWSYSAGIHSSSHQRHAQWDIPMSFQATCHPLHYAACRIKRQVRRQVAPPTISICRLKNNDCAQGSRRYKSFPQLNGEGKVKKSHFRNSQEEKSMIIVNLTRTSEGVSGQPIRTSFAREWKEGSLLVDWASTSGRYSIPNGSRHQQ